MIRATIKAAGLAAMVAASPASAQTAAETENPPPVCRAGDSAKALDFWIGDWIVRNADGEQLGVNRIELSLDGCAIFEHWTSALGGRGKSLFYYDAGNDQWHQVWVTTDTTKHYGLKRKELIDRLDDGSVRFQGSNVLPDGRHYLDRTTLTPHEDGTVRQLIEISLDNGQNWRSTFDAIYLKKR